MKLDTLYSRATNGKINEYSIEIENNKYRTISGYTDGVKTTSEWKVCAAKSYCTAEEQAIKEATAMHRKKMETGSFENISDIDNEIYFEPMLAQDWFKQKDKVKYPVYSQPKLDGVRCIIRADGMWSRNGKPIISAPHIFESLKPLFEANPDLILDGELYADKLNNDLSNQEDVLSDTLELCKDLYSKMYLSEYEIDWDAAIQIFFEKTEDGWRIGRLQP